MVAVSASYHTSLLAVHALFGLGLQHLLNLAATAGGQWPWALGLNTHSIRLLRMLLQTTAVAATAAAMAEVRLCMTVSVCLVARHCS